MLKQWRSEGRAWTGTCLAKSTMFVPLISHDLTQNAHEQLAYSRCPANTNDLATRLCSSCNRRRSMFGLQVVIHYLLIMKATVYCFYSASFNENCSSGVAISLVNYLGCTGLPDHKYLLYLSNLYRPTYHTSNLLKLSKQLFFIAAQNQR